MTKKLYIIKAGSTFAGTAERSGDFEQLIAKGLAVESALVKVIDAVRGEALPEAATCHGVLITGAHCMVTDDLPWSLAIERWLPALVSAEVPLLGICYGHQLMGRAMGGRVGYHPLGREIGTVTIRLRPESRDDQLFSHLPTQFQAHATHAQSVLELPPGALPLAGNDFEQHHAFRLGRCAWGVQFHPEYDSSITRDYIMQQADDINRSGRDVATLLATLGETPEAGSLLRKFARLAIGQRDQ